MTSWEEHKVLEQINGHKLVFVETKDPYETSNALDQYHEVSGLFSFITVY